MRPPTNTPALLHNTSTRPNRSNTAVGPRIDRWPIAHVAGLAHHLDRRDHPSDQGGRFGQCLTVDVGHGHPHPLGGEGQAQRPSDPAAGTGHHRCLPRNSCMAMSSSRRSPSGLSSGRSPIDRSPGQTQVFGEERPDPGDALVGLGNDRTGKGLEHVDQLRPHDEGDACPGLFQALGQSGGVVDEHLAFPYLDAHRGQAAEIGGEQRGGQLRTGIGVAQVGPGPSGRAPTWRPSGPDRRDGRMRPRTGSDRPRARGTPLPREVGCRRPRRARSADTVSPPPAESPAMAMRSGSMPRERRSR